MNSADPQRWSVTQTQAGRRLDQFLAHQLHVGRTWVRRMLSAGGIRIDGRIAKLSDKGRLLTENMVVEVIGLPAGELVAQPEALLTILSQGPGWVIADKPAGQPVHPLRPGETGTLLNALAGRYPNLSDVGEGRLRGGVVHRLDVETSGAVLFAMDPTDWRRFRKAFSSHRTEKVYQALVHGHPADTGSLAMDLYVARHQPARVRVAADGRIVKSSRHCTLQWRVIERYARASRLEILLGTGFLHQIRVMLAEIGHPVIGDSTYGRVDSEIVPRQMLHAWRLRVEEVEAMSPIPADFQAAVDRLRHGDARI